MSEFGIFYLPVVSFIFKNRETHPINNVGPGNLQNCGDEWFRRHHSL